MSEERASGGFWIRVGAALIGSLLSAMNILPILSVVYGPYYWGSEAMVRGATEFLLTWVAPAVATVLFWMYRQARPGKMALGLRVVDATTGRPVEHGPDPARAALHCLHRQVLRLGKQP